MREVDGAQGVSSHSWSIRQAFADQSEPGREGVAGTREAAGVASPHRSPSGRHLVARPFYALTPHSAGRRENVTPVLCGLSASGACSGMMRRVAGADHDTSEAWLTAAVGAAQRGDEAAFREVYRGVHPRLLAYVRTLVGEADAEDVASEAWLQIARDLDRFSGDADRFRGWTATIARNRALDHIRKIGRRPVVGGDDSVLRLIPDQSDTADKALEAMSTGSAMRLIARLPLDQAEAVVLRAVIGLDANGAAEVLGKRPGAVRTAAHRGLRRLAELLQDGTASDGVTFAGAPTQKDVR